MTAWQRTRSGPIFSTSEGPLMPSRRTRARSAGRYGAFGLITEDYVI
jgi:hypothetical protein